MHAHPTVLIKGFNKALDDCGLVDLGIKGCPFTLERGQGSSDWVKERLDRVVVYVDWCFLHSHAIVQMLDVFKSDHSAIFIDVEKPHARKRKMRFMFESSWLKDNGCNDVVYQAWNMGEEFPCRLRACSEMLKQWGGDFGCHLRGKIHCL